MNKMGVRVSVPGRRAVRMYLVNLSEGGQTRVGRPDWLEQSGPVGEERLDRGTGAVRVRVGSTSWRVLKTFVKTLALSLE